MTGAGCLSRVMGPVFVTHIYEEYGTVWTFGMTSVMMAASLLWLWYFQERLEPKELAAVEKDESMEQEMKELVVADDLGEKQNGVGREGSKFMITNSSKY